MFNAFKSMDTPTGHTFRTFPCSHQNIKPILKKGKLHKRGMSITGMRLSVWSEKSLLAYVVSVTVWKMSANVAVVIVQDTSTKM